MEVELFNEGILVMEEENGGVAVGSEMGVCVFGVAVFLALDISHNSLVARREARD